MKRALLLLAALALPAAAQFSIDNILLPEAILGAPYPSVELTTSNGLGPIQWSFILAPSPPSGFVIGPKATGGNVTTGSFCYGLIDAPTGRPVCGGNVQGIAGGYLINVRAQDANGAIATRVFNLQLIQALFIVTSELPDAIIGQSYGVQLQGGGGTGNYSWSLASGALPAGLTLSTNGVIAGTAPNTAGQSSFVVRMTDNTTAASVLRVFNIDVLGGLRITTNALPLAVAGQLLKPFQLTAVGGVNLTWSIPTGWELPDAFELSPDGVLSGGSGNAGSFRVKIRVADNNSGLSDERIFDLYVTMGNLRILENTLPVAAVAFPYQTTLTPAGGLPPYHWAFGSLNNQGLVIDPNTGRIAGTPPSLGTFQVTVTLTDRTGTQFSHVYNLQVVNTITITTSSFPNGIVGEPFTTTLGAIGGQAPYRWTQTGGVLPPGLTLDGVAGTITGTPTSEGVFQFTLHVSDFGGRFADRQFGIVVGKGIAIVTSTLADGVVGQSYGVALQSSGGIAPLTWALIGGSLPAGLTLNASTGVISGAPTATFNSTLTFRVTDNATNTAERSLSLTVVSPLSITTSELTGGSRNSSYSFTLTSTGGRAPFAWSIVSGALPAGLQLATASGVVSGTPTQGGSFAFGVRLTDDSGQDARANFLLNIGDPLTITTGQITATVGQAFSQILTATGGFAPYAFSQVTGSLPPGLTFNPATATISGTPTQAGTYGIVVRVTDQLQQTATSPLAVISILPALPAVTIEGLSAAEPGGQVAVAVRIASAFPVEITGKLFLQFVRNGSGADDTVRFANGSREIGFTIPLGSTRAVFAPGPDAVLLTGTTSGTIVLTSRFDANGLEITPNPTPTTSTNLADRPPSISSFTTQRSGNTITAIITGYTTTREISSGVFRFTARSGSTLQQSEFTVSLAAAFSAWFGSATSNATGGQFRLSVPFNISGDAANVTLTGVTLTNSTGNTVLTGPQ